MRSGSIGCGSMALARAAASSAASKVGSCGFNCGAVPITRTGRLARRASAIRLSIALRRSFQRAALAQPLSVMMKSGPFPATRCAGFQIGSARARMTSAAIAMRRSRSQSGVWAGVSSSRTRPTRSRIAGNRTRFGSGGLTRSNHQMAGRTNSAASIQGVAKASGPSASIDQTPALEARRAAIAPESVP